jgi:hypothetical protein
MRRTDARRRATHATGCSAAALKADLVHNYK